MRFIPLFSGSSGNCSVIQTEKATLLVDAGLTGKAVCGALASAGINPASVDGILVTHDHIDHTRRRNTFTQVRYARLCQCRHMGGNESHREAGGFQERACFSHR